MVYSLYGGLKIAKVLAKFNSTEICTVKLDIILNNESLE